jgi:hypothetical protein
MNDSYLNSSLNTSAAEDTVSLLQESRTLFAKAPECSDLKQIARLLNDAREREQEVLTQGSKAIIHALASNNEDEYDEVMKQLNELNEQSSRLEAERSNLRMEADSAVRERQLVEEIQRLETEEQEKQKQYQLSGGEAKLRRRAETESFKNGPTNMRRMLSLMRHITRVVWDLDCDEEDTAGTVIDQKENIIKQFRYGPLKNQNGEMDEYKLANKIWQAIG